MFPWIYNPNRNTVLIPNGIHCFNTNQLAPKPPKIHIKSITLFLRPPHSPSQIVAVFRRLMATFSLYVTLWYPNSPPPKKKKLPRAVEVRGLPFNTLFLGHPNLLPQMTSQPSLLFILKQSLPIDRWIDRMNTELDLYRQALTPYLREQRGLKMITAEVQKYF